MSLARPAAIAAECYLAKASAKTVWIVLAVRCEDGTVGYGEITFFGAEQAMASEVARLNRILSEQRPCGVGAALAAFRQAQMSDIRRVCLNGLEQALLDAAARRTGQSLADSLGGKVRAQVPSYANINRGIADRSPEGFASQARNVVERQGFQALKVAPFDGVHWLRQQLGEHRRGVARGLERVQAVREAVGGNVEVLVDFHGRLAPASMAAVLRELVALGAYWIEEPVDSFAHPPDVLRQVRHQANDLGIMVAGGEEIRSLHQAARLLEIGAFDVILPDLRLTGVRAGMAILAMAAEHGVHPSLHNPVGPVLDAASRHVASAADAFLILERQIGETPLFDALRGSAIAHSADGSAVEDAPGIGFVPCQRTLKEAAEAGAQTADSFVGIAGAGPDA